MLVYTLRRVLIAVPTLLLISLILFLLLDLAPGDPTAQLPLTIPPDVKEKIRQSLGLGEPIHVRYLLWLQQFFVNEPLHLISQLTGLDLGDDRHRVISWQTRSPVVDLVIERLPQTLWVVGLSYVAGIAIGLPVGIVSARHQYGWFDQLGTFVSMVGFSVPTFFSGVLMIVVFSVELGWFPSIYDTTHRVTGWDSLLYQLRQMATPVTVLALYNAAQISRFMRASTLDNLNLDYVRTARAKGMSERRVIFVHVLRNAVGPVVTVVALGVPGIFGGAIITEQIFKVTPEQGEPALHGALRHALGLGHQAYAPSAGVIGFFLQGAVDQLRYLLIIIGARASRAKLVMQSLYAAFDKSSPPFAHRRGRGVQAFGHCRIGQSLRTGQNDSGPLDQTVGHRGGLRHSGQLFALFVGEHQRGKGASAHHRQGLPLHVRPIP